MPSLEDKVHDKLVSGLSDSRVSPAVLAIKMHRENLYVNESFMQYMTNYIIQLAESPLIPVQLAEIQQQCRALKISLEELGLTGSTRKSLDINEYLVV
jgi:hypothetical protein